jgi:uncharacterized protein YkwD
MDDASPVTPSSRILPVLGLLGLLFVVGIVIRHALAAKPTVTPPALPMPLPQTSIPTPTNTPEAAFPTGTSTQPTTDLEAVNAYWREAVNRLRSSQSLRPLVTDQRLVQSAGDWAQELARQQTLTHTRPDGKTMHQWIDAKGLAFTKRGSPDGWNGNYFTENIARAYTKNDPASLERALDRTLADFLAEVAGDDAHKRTLFHPDWNAVGLNWAFEHVTSSEPRAYFVMHYGSLEQP